MSKQRIKFNGYIFVDPDVIEGDYAELDSAVIGGRVYVHKLGKIFAIVSDRPDSKQYELMRTRLIASQKNLK